ncbi:MAG: hypothetical protein FJX76_08360 [Armatimonadetes bacterium]|nr:hypothetical protein [Armatimonadota bacterium]
MTSRNVLVTVSEGEGSERGLEGIRAALGLARGFEGHKVRVLFRGPAVQWMRAGNGAHVAAGAILMHLRATVPMYVEAAALEGTGMSRETLDASAHLAEPHEVTTLMEAAEARLDF